MSWISNHFHKCCSLDEIDISHHLLLNADGKIQLLFNVEISHMSVMGHLLVKALETLRYVEMTRVITCRLCPSDAYRLWFCLHSVPPVCLSESRVTLSHPCQDHILDSDSSLIMQCHQEINWLCGSGQDNMATFSMYFTGDPGQGPGFAFMLSTRQCWP